MMHMCHIHPRIKIFARDPFLIDWVDDPSSTRVLPRLAEMISIGLFANNPYAGIKT
jgi:hypothetical protein